jgi:hypothetical protein
MMPAQRLGAHGRTATALVFACALGFDSDDVLVRIEVKHDSRGLRIGAAMVDRQIRRFRGAGWHALTARISAGASPSVVA